jgi:hypothetical protein
MQGLLGKIIVVIGLLATGCTLMVSGCEMNGRVVDAETGAPIPGALVIAEWSGDVGGPVQSSQVCFHMEIATTDADGRYHIPGWSRRPVTDWEGGFFGVRNVEISRRTYKAGYAHDKYDPNDSENILMSPVNTLSVERLIDLAHVGTRGCGSADGSLIQEVSIWRAVCDEVRNYSEARVPQKAFRNEAFLELVNDQLLAIQKQLAADQRAPSQTSFDRCN